MEHQQPINSSQKNAASEAAVCAKPEATTYEAEHPLQRLQSSLGNRAVGRHIQTKLKISEPGDLHEQEADRVVNEVMRMPDPSGEGGILTASGKPHGNPIGNSQLQRKCAGCEEDEKLLQTKPIPGEGVSTDAVSSELGSGGQPLDSSVRFFFEPRFGHDFDHVRVHTDARAAGSARAVNALAYTVGQDIVFGSGQYAPSTEAGRTLLAHELTHVVQQGSAPSTAAANAPGISHSTPQIQRARLPCTTRTTVDVFSVDLPGATRSINDDLATANSMLCQCGLELNVVGGESFNTTLLDADPPAGVLNAPAGTVRALTGEETSLLAHKPGGASVIHVYYVPSFTGPKLAESFWPAQHGEQAVVVGNAAIPVVMPHELGHVLLNNGSHHTNVDNMMAAGNVNSGAGELEQTQCNLMP